VLYDCRKNLDNNTRSPDRQPTAAQGKCVRPQLIQHPLIRLLLAAVCVYAVGRALYTGEVRVNDSRYNRNEAPVRYWFTIALSCFLIYAFGSPGIYEMLK
jgi:hypothetical protein